MFSLHETTRIRICRVAFFALCLAPTCLVAAWCVTVRQPSYRRAHERTLGDLLGWQAQIERVGLPRPGLVLYEGLQLVDPESGQLLAHAPFVEVEQSGTATTVSLPFPAQLNGRRLQALLASAERRLRALDETESLRIDAPNITLHLADGDQTLVDVAGDCLRVDGEARLNVSFRLATAGNAAADADKSAAMVELSIARSGESPAVTSIRLNTTSAPLPCSLVASSWPAAERLGKASTFGGTLSAARRHGVWRWEVSGRLAAIDLERLTSPFPHALSGTATLDLARATIRGGRLEAATGKLSAGPGIVSRSLVHAAQENLQLEASPHATTGRDNRLEYRKLALAFEIDGAGLALRGDVDGARGAVLVDDKQVLVRQPSAARQPVVNLLRTLVPQSAIQVPATRETSGLASFLPVPPVVPPPGSEATLPRVRVK